MDLHAETGEEAPVVIERATGVWTVSINRPRRRNALDDEALIHLRKAFEDAEDDPSVVGIVLTGTGDLAFCAGSDLKALATMSREEQVRHTALGQRVMQTIEGSRCVTIAAVEGYALGGGLELALACDLIVAGASAQFGLPELRRGMLPAWGGTFRLTRAIGLAQARAVLLGGEILKIDRAVQCGLVLEGVEAGGAAAAARRRLSDLAEHASAESISLAKRLLMAGTRGSAEDASLMELLAETVQSFSEAYGRDSS